MRLHLLGDLCRYLLIKHRIPREFRSLFPEVNEAFVQLSFNLIVFGLLLTEIKVKHSLVKERAENCFGLALPSSALLNSLWMRLHLL